jgi:septal ring factor EnvC (AmiA/AmiB activator)
LQAFVDVLSAYCGGADASEVVSARASEAALKAKVEALSAQLEGHELTAKLKAAAQEEQTLKEQLESAHAATDAVRAEVAGLCVRVKELESQLSQARTECELYISEIEVSLLSHVLAGLSSTKQHDGCSCPAVVANAVSSPSVDGPSLSTHLPLPV